MAFAEGHTRHEKGRVLYGWPKDKGFWSVLEVYFNKGSVQRKEGIKDYKFNRLFG